MQNANSPTILLFTRRKMILFFSSRCALNATKILHAFSESKEYPSYTETNHKCQTVHLFCRAPSPIFHHFKAQFARARPTILPVVTPTTNSLFLPFLFLSFSIARALVGSDNPRHRSLSFRVHRSRLRLSTTTTTTMNRHPDFA